MSLLRDAPDGPSLVVCSTCRFSVDARDDDEGARGGARLAQALRVVQQEERIATGLTIEEMPCLFNCGQHCSVHLRSPGKIGYVLGRLEPTADSARALLTYAQAYMESIEGVVPYREWPEGVKGRFIVRTPPAGKIVGG